MTARRKALARTVRYGGPAAVSLAMGLLVAGAIGLPFASQAQGDSDHAAMSVERSQSVATERHIATLRARLHITAAQEPLWRPLASAMRDNVANLDRVYANRARQYNSMSAVDDLKSYAHMQETEAQNVNALIAPFARLYASFSVAQKRDADETFRRFTENAVKNSR